MIYIVYNSQRDGRLRFENCCYVCSETQKKKHTQFGMVKIPVALATDEMSVSKRSNSLSLSKNHKTY